jgi:c-di-AMP phosphodiesterase-like protein
MKHLNRAVTTRLFCYTLILIILFILKIHEKNIFLTFIGLVFIIFSKIEDSTLDIQRKFTFIEMLKNPFQSSFWSNLFKFFAYSFLIASLIKMYFKN